MNEGPVKRYTLLVLFQAQQDHATELTIGPVSGIHAAIRYKVGDTWYDMSPPPASILPEVVTEVERLAAITNRPCPKDGLIDLAFGGTRLRWQVRMTSANADCVLTPIEQCR